MTRRRRTALTVALAMIAQILVPLALQRGAWAEDGLFPPACSLILATAGDRAPDGDMPPAPCPFCQLATAPAVEPASPAIPAVWPMDAPPPALAAPERPARSASRPPAPPRGPPSRA